MYFFSKFNSIAQQSNKINKQYDLSENTGNFKTDSKQAQYLQKPASLK